MPFSFFTQPKINRIANHLESTLAEICRDRWVRYIAVASNNHPIEYKGHLREAPTNLDEVIESFSLFRPKDHFSWDIFPELSDVNSNYQLANAKEQYRFYSELLLASQEIKRELMNEKPNYDAIVRLAKRIKESSTIVPSIVGGGEVDIKVDWRVGSNIVSDFFSGVIGSIHAPIMTIASILCIPAYLFSYSEYCGSPQFFLDTALYFTTSLCQIISTILFPLNMLYSKYSTDSFNVVTKASVERGLDAIIALAQPEGMSINAELEEREGSDLSNID